MDRSKKEVVAIMLRFSSKLHLSFLMVLIYSGLTHTSVAQVERDGAQKTSLDTRPALHLKFDGKKLDPSARQFPATSDDDLGFVPGIANQCFRVGSAGRASFATIDLGDLKLDREHDFSVEFWLRTTSNSNQRFVVLSQKQIPDNSLRAHKNKGWAFCVSNGTWAWNVGSGSRRLTYERDNGQHMPINDGRWHQLVMTFDHSNSLIKLYYDGKNRAIYNIADGGGFDFSNESPLTIGWSGDVDPGDSTLPAIEKGATQLQQLVDMFNELGLGNLKPDELMSLVIDPERLIRSRNKDDLDQAKNLSQEKIDSIKSFTRQLSANPYTVHQSADFMRVAPLLKLFSLKNENIEINAQKAREFKKQEQLSRPEFDMDELAIWQRSLSAKEVIERYSNHFQPTGIQLKENLNVLTAGAFNIHHGGIHETIEEDGWDSRKTIVDLIRRENIDVVMMQETYSSGDFIAAELGYYFATTVDWDNLNQGANISVLSRYPIKTISVPPNSAFMNVAALVSLSDQQDIYVMSNWYGMRNFQDVFEFHRSRFSNSANVPILFGGDFNAVPHTDGGTSPASEMLLEAGFQDAFREQYPNAKTHPGITHQSGSRIDQLYYKGAGLRNKATEVLSTWPSKFPSDHYLIKSVFDLNYRTKKAD